MNDGKQQSHIKRAQKESQLLKEMSTLLMKVTMEEASLRSLFINRVALSPDRSVCYIYFYNSDGEKAFQDLLPTLILYKPSLRKALSTAIPSRYTPELCFQFDKQFEKQMRIDTLLQKIKEEDKL